MAEVGVLNLTIHDNSEDAAEGLDRLAAALGKVQKAIGTGIDLSGVSTTLSSLNTAVTDSKALANIGTFLNAIGAYSDAIKKLKKNTEGFATIDTNPIKEIQTALNDGIKIGQAGTQLGKLRDALSGEWNTANAADAATALQSITEGVKGINGSNITTATKNINALADSLNKAAAAVKNVNDTPGAHDYLGMQVLAQSAGTEVADKVAEGIKSSKETIVEAAVSTAKEAVEEAKKEIESTNQLNGWELAKYTGRFSSSQEYGSGSGTGFDGLLQKTTETTQKITEEYKQMTGAIEGTPLDFSKFMQAQIPLSALGSKIDEVSQQWQRYGGMVKETFEIVQKMADTTPMDKVLDAEEAIKQQVQDTNQALIEQINLNKKVYAPYEDQNQQLLERNYGAYREAYLSGDEMWQAEAQRKYGFTPRAFEEGGTYADALKITLEDVDRYVDEFIEKTNQPAGTLLRDTIDEATGASRAIVDGTTGMTIALKDAKNAANSANSIMSALARSEGVNNSADAVIKLRYASEDAISKFQELYNRIGYLWDEYDKLSEMSEFDKKGNPTGRDQKMNSKLLEIMRVYDQLDKVVQKANEAREAMNFENLKASSDNLQREYGMELVDNLVNHYSEIDLMTMKMNGLKQALADDINQNKVDTQQIAERTMAIQKLRDKIEELTKAQEGATGEAKKMSSEHVTLGSAMKSMFPTLTGIVKRFKGMLISRSIRYVIRQIASGFSEGVQNVYQYSKAIGSAFAPAMDTAATALAQMKNSIAAAASPLIQSLIPVLQTVINWFITAINYVNQFFALLNGQQTWTRALPKTVDAFDKQEKGAKKAGAALKDLLADWDELNIIQSQGGGGSGVGNQNTAEEYLEMFEEVGRFDSKIKETVQFIKDNFDTIITLAEGIGAAILAWKISSAFGKDLNLLQKLELAAGLTLLVTGVKLAASAGYSIGKNGLNGENVGDAVLSVLAGMGGGALIGFSLAGVPGAVIGATVGTLLTLSVMKLAIDKGKLDSLYGDVEEDIETIRTNLENDLLNVDAKLDITVYKAQVKNVSAAVGKVKSALTELEKTYPVSVMITSDTEEDFREKVNKLVEATNEATKTNAAAMKEVYVPATAQFTPDFIDDAWETIGNSVTKLGKQIGEELDKEITDNTKLDELQRKLERLAEIMVDVTKTSEFSGSVSVAGSKIRANNFANYNRDTVQAYMDEYNSLLDNTMGDALGKAQTEYKSIATLIAGLQESTTNNTLEGQELEDAKRQLEIAMDDYKKKFGIEYNPKIIPDLTKYAQTLFDKWTNAGSSLYEQDILGALSRAMEMNPDDSNWRKTAMNSAADANVKDTDKWVKDYIESQKTFLRNAIAEESGMSIGSVEKFLENSGINPLEFFDKKYVQEYQNKIMSWLSEQNVSEERKKSILAAIGLDLDDMEKYIKKVKEDAANAKAESVKKAQADIKEMVKDGIYTPYEQNQLAEMYGAEIAQEVEALIDAKKYMKPFDETETPIGTINHSMQAAESAVLPDWATSGDAMTYVQTGEVPEMPVSPVIEEEGFDSLQQQFKTHDPDGMPMEVNPYISETWDGFKFDDSTLEGIYKHLNWQLADAGFEGGNRQPFQNVIEELKKSGSIDQMNELSDLIERLGVVDAFKQFENQSKVDETNATEVVELLKQIYEYFTDPSKRTDPNSGAAMLPAKAAQMGAAGIVGGNRTVVDVGWGNENNTTSEPQQIEFDSQSMTTSVENGVSKGVQSMSTDVVAALNTVAGWLQRLYNKDTAVVVQPSTSLGRAVGRSNSDLGRVTGYAVD